MLRRNHPCMSCQVAAMISASYWTFIGNMPQVSRHYRYTPKALIPGLFAELAISLVMLKHRNHQNPIQEAMARGIQDMLSQLSCCSHSHWPSISLAAWCTSRYASAASAKRLASTPAPNLAISATNPNDPATRSHLY